MKENKIPIREVLLLAAGECAVCLIVCAVFLLLGKFDYTVLLGGLLGATVTVLNFLMLCISLNKAIDKYLGAAELEGLASYESREGLDSEVEQDESKTESEAEKMLKVNQAKVQNSIKLSYILRMLVMIATLVISAFVGVFNLIATVIPLLMFRPLLNLSVLIKRKEK